MKFEKFVVQKMIKRGIEILLIILVIFLGFLRVRLLVADIYLRKGQILANRGKPEEAIVEYEKGLRLDKHNGLGWFWAGISFHKIGEYEKAIVALNRAETNWVCKDLYNIGGLCYVKKGEYKKALKEFEAAVTLFPNFADGWYNLGNAELVQASIQISENQSELARNSIARAKEAFEKARIFNPDYEVPEQLEKLYHEVTK